MIKEKYSGIRPIYIVSLTKWNLWNLKCTTNKSNDLLGILVHLMKLMMRNNILNSTKQAILVSIFFIIIISELGAVI